MKYFILLPSARDVGTPYDDIHWAAVLKSVSGFEMYRKKHGRISPRDIVDFLLLDREFPRSIRFCVHGADESLHAITGSPRASFVYPSEQVMGLLRAELDFTPVDRILGGGLHEYLDSLQEKMNTVDNGILNDFVTPAAGRAKSAGAPRGLIPACRIRVALHHKTSYTYDRLVTLSPQVDPAAARAALPHAGHGVLAARSSPKTHFLNWQQDPHSNFLARVVFPERVAALHGGSRSGGGDDGDQSVRLLPGALRREVSVPLRGRAASTN